MALGEQVACSAAAFNLGYRRWLDGLRGVAILLVLAFHLRLVPGGFLGVDVFFVLSGFLITTLLAAEWQRRGTIDLPRFYLRRCLRLLPAFGVLLLLCAVAAALAPSAQEGAALRREIVVAGCYVANWPALHQTAMPTLGHTWSLSIEEQFYLLWPLLLLGMLKLGLSRRAILFLVCGGIAASAVLRLTLYLSPPAGMDKTAQGMLLYLGLHTRADTLLIGCLTGLLAAWNLLPGSRRFLAMTGFLAVVGGAGLGYMVLNKAVEHAQFYYGLFTVVALSVAVLLVRLLAAPSRFASLILESTPLVGVGRISYALYLFHAPLIYWLRPAGLGWHYPAHTSLVLGLALAAAIACYCCIERPCLALKERFDSQRCAARANLPSELRLALHADSTAVPGCQ